MTMTIISKRNNISNNRINIVSNKTLIEANSINISSIKIPNFNNNLWWDKCMDSNKCKCLSKWINNSQWCNFLLWSIADSQCLRWIADKTTDLRCNIKWVGNNNNKTFKKGDFKGNISNRILEVVYDQFWYF